MIVEGRLRKCLVPLEVTSMSSVFLSLSLSMFAVAQDYFLPSLTDLFNSSLASAIFPQCIKSALVTPILKKRCLVHNDLNNYRPVSNLCFIAKILEKLVLSQFSSYLNSHNFYNTCQSAYRPFTALKQLF